jgi:hypothetical protein
MKRGKILASIAFQHLRRGLVLAGAVLACSGGVSVWAQGLSYQKAIDDPVFGGTNISPSSAYVTGNADNDNLWGLRTGFGTAGPFGSGEVWQAGINEDVPQLTQTVHGLTPGNSYDLYAAYWTDDDENWTVRAGTQSGNLTLYSFNGDHRAQPVPGSTIGLTAGAAIWSSVPPPTDAGTPFTQERTSMDPFGDPLVMLLAYAGQATADINGEINVYVDDLPFGGGPNRTWFDGVAFRPASATAVALTTSINRDTGAITVHNATSQNFQIQSYFVDSVAGAIDASQWSTINATNPAWTVTATPDPNAPYATSFSEDGGGNLVTIPAGGSLSFGNAWRMTPYEDVRIYLTLADGTLAAFSPEYTGAAALVGDLNGDGIINIANDYQTLLNNMHTSLAGLGLTAVERYQLGDLTNDSLVNFFDFAAFREAYDQANGAGAFQAAVGSVPEPSSLAMLMVLGALAGACCRCRIGRYAMAVVLCCLVTHDAKAVTLLSVDVDHRAAPVTVPGYSSYLMEPSGALGTTSATVDGYTVTLTAVNAAGSPLGAIDDRQRATPTTAPTLNDLYRDFIFAGGSTGAGGGIDMVVDSGGALMPNTSYLFSLYSFDTGSTGARSADWLDGNASNTVAFSTSFNGSNSPTVDEQYKFTGALRTDASGNLFLRGRNTSPGGALGVFVNGFEIAEHIELTLEINTTTGVARFVNEQNTNFDMSYYEIRSASGSLNTGGWSPLGGPPAGTGWDPVPNSTSSLLSEVNLQSSSSFAPGSSMSLGTPFTMGGTQDVRFFYAAPGESSLRPGIVSFVNGGGLAGDYNSDGKVDAADYVVWRKTDGSQQGYDTWRNNFGAMAGSGAASAAAGAVAAVPEPASLMLLVFAASLGAVWRRR